MSGGGTPKGFPTPEALASVDLQTTPLKGWMDPKINFEGRRGTWSYPAGAKNLKALKMHNPREWSPAEQSCKTPTHNKDAKILRNTMEKLQDPT